MVYDPTAIVALDTLGAFSNTQYTSMIRQSQETGSPAEELCRQQGGIYAQV